MADVLRQSEENGNRVAVMEAELARLRADQDRRLRALERAAAAAAAAQAGATGHRRARRRAPKPKTADRAGAETGRRRQAAAATPVDPANDPAEAAYDEGYQLWKAGKYDAAITSLRAFSSAYPNHRRASWANNLAGRALLDKGQPRAAAEALLANYRPNPKGERAPDSLFYLGQALMKLSQPGRPARPMPSSKPSMAPRCGRS